MRNKDATRQEIKEKVCEDRISALPDALLVQILMLIPIKDAVATSVLSKPWRYIWTLMPKLVCKDTKNSKSLWWFLEKSLHLHKAPILEHLEVKLGSRCPGDVDVGKLISKAVERNIRLLDFNLEWSSAKPISLPKTLYTCKTLKELILSNKILIEPPFEAFLPSLNKLELINVVYKDEGSVTRLLSSCPVLKTLVVVRDEKDNVIKFSVKVPSLNSLVYVKNNEDDDGVCSCCFCRGSLIIDCPQLKYLRVDDFSEDDCLIESMNPPNLTMARVDVGTPPNENFLTYLSSVMFLRMTWTNETEVFCSWVNYSQLRECMLRPCLAEYWVESVMLLLDNSPNLKVLMIDTKDIGESDDLPPWSYVPECLSSQLEVLEWRKYGGTRDEKQLLAYILANSKCLKRAGISMRYSDEDCNDKKKKKLRQELKSMPRASLSSQVLFPAKYKWRSLLAQHDLF
ncbi:F-box domain-containing protein [Hirschfeldia incana]|nr:F-box domain-containing protein [Hirschfeldia incana]